MLKLQNRRTYAGNNMPESNESSAGSNQEELSSQNHTTTTTAGSITGRHDLVFPSQLLERHRMELPPAHLVAEDIPSVAPAFRNFEEDDVLRHGSGSDSSPQRLFVEEANALINAALSRKPEGTSVIEPDSVLGESGRLYHGYKDGKYFLPNDAVSRKQAETSQQKEITF